MASILTLSFQQAERSPLACANVKLLEPSLFSGIKPLRVTPPVRYTNHEGLGCVILQDRVKGLELGMTSIGTFGRAGLTVSFAKRIRLRPCSELGFCVPNCVRRIEHVLISFGAFQQREGFESWNLG